MKVIRDIDLIPQGTDGASVALGNFDGVHLGHRYIIEQAKRPDHVWGVVTFEPHPKQVFRPDIAPFRLTSAETRAARIAEMGVDILIELPFVSALSSLSPREFVKTILVDGLRVRHVVVGQDFRFGAKRSGDGTMLSELGAEYGFRATIAPLIKKDDVEISSTRIREALSMGYPQKAAKMLGHWHRIDGEVIHGDKRGRDLGYPTANLSMDGRHLPKFGVYAVTVSVNTQREPRRYHGVASLGIRPMFGINTPNLETHIFDYAGDLYGQSLSISLVSYLRPEMRFSSVDDLIDQMDRDSTEARKILQTTASLFE